MSTKKTCAVLALAVAGLISAGSAAQARPWVVVRPRPVAVRPAPVAIHRAPCRPGLVVAPVAPRIWLAGRWKWHPFLHRHIWVPGHWR